MIPLPGERRQNFFRANPELLGAFVGAQIVEVTDVDYVGARVEVFNSNGVRWARVLKKKAFGTVAGESDLPNVGELGVILPVNGDAKSAVWLGSLNSIEPSNTIEKDSNYTSDAALVHRKYEKHETGSFRLLDKLGNLTWSLFKKASQESDPALQNMKITISNAGVISVTHYEADGVTPDVTFSMDKNGSVTLESPAHQISFISKAGSEIFRYLHKIKNAIIQVTQDGDIVLNAAGNMLTIEQSSGSISGMTAHGAAIELSDEFQVMTPQGSSIIVGDKEAQMATKDGSSVLIDGTKQQIQVNAQNVLINGGTVSLGNGEEQIPLMTSGFFTLWNAVKALIAAHSHTSNNQPSATLAPLATPDVPTPGTNVTAQVLGA